MEPLVVVCKNIWQFFKLYSIAHYLGYRFESKRDYGFLFLWLLYGVRGLSFEQKNKLMYVEKGSELDSIDFEEFLLVLYGKI